MALGMAALLLATTAAAEPGIENPDATVPDRLMVHLSQAQDSMLSPLPVPEDLETVLGVGLATHTACAPLPLQTFTSGQHHTWYAVLTTAEIHYMDGVPSAPAGSGPGADIRFDPEVPMELRFFLVTQGPAPGQDAPMIVPQVVLEAQVREGDAISVDHRALDAGRVVARGQTDPATLSPLLDGHPHVEHTETEDRHIYAFRLPLEWQGEPVVPQQRGMNLRVDAYVEEPACQAGSMMPDWVHPYSGPGMRPQLDFALGDPIRILRLAPQVHNGTLAVQAEVASPWGLLDVGPTTVETSVDGPSALQPGPIMARSGSRVLVEGSTQSESLHCHCHPTDRVEIEQLFDVDGAPDGTYTVDLTATNAAGTATARAQATFDLPGGQRTVCRASGDEAFCQELDAAASKPSPAGLAPILGLLAAWALVRRGAGKP